MLDFGSGKKKFSGFRETDYLTEGINSVVGLTRPLAWRIIAQPRSQGSPLLMGRVGEKPEDEINQPST